VKSSPFRKLVAILRICRKFGPYFKDVWVSSEVVLSSLSDFGDFRNFFLGTPCPTFPKVIKCENPPIHEVTISISSYQITFSVNDIVACVADMPHQVNSANLLPIAVLVAAGGSVELISCNTNT